MMYTHSDYYHSFYCCDYYYSDCYDYWVQHSLHYFLMHHLYPKGGHFTLDLFVNIYVYKGSILIPSSFKEERVNY